MLNVNFKEQINSALNRISSHILKTPLIESHSLSAITGANVFLKCENMQTTNAFKVRGAFNKLLSINKIALSKGIITASSGNHGAAVAFAANKLNIRPIIYIPKNVSKTKINMIERFGADIHFAGEDCAVSEKDARAYAKEHNMTYISPYNDIDIVTGQGTMAYEILEDMPEVDDVFVAIGGGGLISGIAGYMKSVKPACMIHGCLPKNSPVMYECIKAGKVIDVDIKPTSSDATAGNMDKDSITFEFCQQYVDDYHLATEDEIKDGIKHFLFEEHMLVEGAVGVVLAALMQQKNKLKNRNVVIVVCGSNISRNDMRAVMTE